VIEVIKNYLKSISDEDLNSSLLVQSGYNKDTISFNNIVINRYKTSKNNSELVSILYIYKDNNFIDIVGIGRGSTIYSQKSYLNKYSVYIAFEKLADIVKNPDIRYFFKMLQENPLLIDTHISNVAIDRIIEKENDKKELWANYFATQIAFNSHMGYLDSVLISLLKRAIYNYKKKKFTKKTTLQIYKKIAKNMLIAYDPYCFYRIPKERVIKKVNSYGYNGNIGYLQNIYFTEPQEDSGIFDTAKEYYKIDINNVNKEIKNEIRKNRNSLFTIIDNVVYFSKIRHIDIEVKKKKEENGKGVKSYKAMSFYNQSTISYFNIKLLLSEYNISNKEIEKQAEKLFKRIRDFGLMDKIFKDDDLFIIRPLPNFKYSKRKVEKMEESLKEVIAQLLRHYRAQDKDFDDSKKDRNIQAKDIKLTKGII
jgi:hypothetical protein